MSLSMVAVLPLAEASALMALAVALLIFEFVIFSWGLLTVAATAMAVWACVIAWAVAPAVGGIFILACLAVGVSAARWARRLARMTPLVNQADLAGDAGYHHLAETLGITVGSMGVLVTDALPTGRARFGQHEIDVRLDGAPLAHGTKVVVLRIEGASITVAYAP
jgi:membrane-bound ClpP family serine protease